MASGQQQFSKGETLELARHITNIAVLENRRKWSVQLSIFVVTQTMRAHLDEMHPLFFRDMA